MNNISYITFTIYSKDFEEDSYTITANKGDSNYELALNLLSLYNSGMENLQDCFDENITDILVTFSGS